jgi:hypothetical protein
MIRTQHPFVGRINVNIRSELAIEILPSEPYRKREKIQRGARYCKLWRGVDWGGRFDEGLPRTLLQNQLDDNETRRQGLT